MNEFKLYHAYTACTRVTLTALEEVGVDYDDHMLDMSVREHLSPEYLAVNAQGKVPALAIGDDVLTENGAILSYLNERFPEAGLLPHAGDALARAHILSDLFWVSSGWHPVVRANKVPFLWTVGDHLPVREKGRQLLTPLVRQLDEKMLRQPWWFGDTWSIVDIYLWWAYINAEIGEFPLEGWEGIAAHRARCEARPALQRALAREEAAHLALQRRKAQG